MLSPVPPVTNIMDPHEVEAIRKQQIVRRIVSYFGTQQSVAEQPEIMVDQSAVSLWLRRGRIPSERQPQILLASRRLVTEGKKDRVLAPWEFFYLPEEVDENGEPKQ